MPVAGHERYVEVTEVKKVYRNGTAEGIEVVSSLSFALPRGQFVAFSGRRVAAKALC